jgi:hypothetical protein
MPRYFGELVFVPVAWFCFMLTRRGRTWANASNAAPILPAPDVLAPVAIWLVVPYAIFSLAATKMTAYVMTAAPAVFLIEALFWLWLVQRPLPSTGWGRAVRWTTLTLLIALPARYGIERLKIWPTYDANPVWARELRALPARLGAGPVVLFNLDRPIEAMFYTPFQAYPDVPALSEVAALKHDGYRVVVLDHGDLPPAASRSPALVEAEVVRVSQWPSAPRPSGSATDDER